MAGERKLVRDGEEKYPSNSETTRVRRPESDEKKDGDERQKRESVIKGSVRKQKKPLGKKFSESFFGDDTKSVGEYIIHDVLIPALKATMSDMVTGGIEMLLFGERRSGRTTRDRGKSYVSYSSYYNRDRDRDDRPFKRDVSRSSRARHDFDDIIFETRSDAEEVLTHLVDLTLDYGVASVADFYELSNIEGSFTDNKWGWTSLRGACTDRVRDGYVIRLPQPKPID